METGCIVIATLPSTGWSFHFVHHFPAQLTCAVCGCRVLRCIVVRVPDDDWTKIQISPSRSVSTKGQRLSPRCQSLRASLFAHQGILLDLRYAG